MSTTVMMNAVKKRAQSKAQSLKEKNDQSSKEKTAQSAQSLKEKKGDYFKPKPQPRKHNKEHDALVAWEACMAVVEASDDAARFACDECDCDATLTNYKDGVVLVPRGTEGRSPLAYLANPHLVFKDSFSLLGTREKDSLRSWPDNAIRTALALLCHECHQGPQDRPPSQDPPPSLVHFGFVDEVFMRSTEVIPVAATVDMLMMVGHVLVPTPHYALLQFHKPYAGAGTVVIWDSIGEPAVHVSKWSRHIGAIFQRYWPERIKDRIKDNGVVICGRATRQAAQKKLIPEFPRGN
jgi:hypothetical protein